MKIKRRNNVTPQVFLIQNPDSWPKIVSSRAALLPFCFTFTAGLAFRIFFYLFQCSGSHYIVCVCIYRLSCTPNTLLTHGNSRSRTCDRPRQKLHEPRTTLKCCVSSINMTTRPLQYSLQVSCCENERCVNGCIITFLTDCFLFFFFPFPACMTMLTRKKEECE